MKIRLSFWLMVMGAGLYLQGCASNSPKIDIQNVKVENLQYAKYDGKLIWQDQPINMQKYVSQDEAIKYCKNLRLLDMEGWRLPSIPEVEADISVFDKLKFVRTNKSYHTSSRRCDQLDYVNDITAIPLTAVVGTLAVLTGSDVDMGMECQYSVTANRGIRKAQRTKKALFRCVLDKDKYLQQKGKQLQKVASLHARGTYGAYLEAFKYSHDMKDIKKANELASTESQKLEVEKYFMRYTTDYSKIFDVIDGETGASNIKTDGGNFFGISGGSQAKKDFTKKFIVKSDFLEYGDYVVKVKFNLDIVYNVHQLMGDFDKKERAEVIVKYHLNRENHYRDAKNVTFKNIMVNAGVSAFGIRTFSAKMKSNQLSYEIVGVE